MLLAHLMEWDLSSVRFKDMTERVQSQKKYQVGLQSEACREEVCREEGLGGKLA